MYRSHFCYVIKGAHAAGRHNPRSITPFHATVSQLTVFVSPRQFKVRFIKASWINFIKIVLMVLSASSNA